MSNRQSSHSAIVYKLKQFGRSNLTLLPEGFFVSNIWKWNVQWNSAELWLIRTRMFFHITSWKVPVQYECLWANDSRIQRKTWLQWLMWLSTQSIGKDIKASSYFFTRRAADVCLLHCDDRRSHKWFAKRP